MEKDWALKLFSKSVLKQQKYKEIIALLPLTDSLQCLDIGGDNGVISYLLRQGGGKWASADMNQTAVESIKRLVQNNVYQIGETLEPFSDNQFDCVVIADYLEHIADDAGFIQEIYRVLRPGGELIINVPHKKNSLLRKFRLVIGQTDERHGHIRPGYTIEEIKSLISQYFLTLSAHTYSRFFSELIDTMITFCLDILQKVNHSAQKEQESEPGKGDLVTKDSMDKNLKVFKIYSLIYPVVRLISRADNFIPFLDGYKLIVHARSNKTQQTDIAAPQPRETPDIETSSDDYATRFSGSIGSWFLKIQENATRKMLKDMNCQSILDVGGGHGQLARMMTEEGYKITTFGSSDACKRRIQHFIDTNQISFCAGDLLRLPFPDRAFDVVLSFRLVSHVDGWRELLSEFCRVAQKGVIIDYPTLASINYFAPLFFATKKKYEKNTRNFQCFQESELLSVFELNGFAFSDRYGQFFFPMVIHRMMKSPAISGALEGFTRLCGLNKLFGSPVILKVIRKENGS